LALRFRRLLPSALEERLHLGTSSPAVPPLPPDVFRTEDIFQTCNDFYGGQLGLRGAWQRGCWSVAATGKIALGDTHQRTRIDGTLLTNDFTQLTQLQAFPGGYLALPTNIGGHSRDAFAVLPQADVQVGWTPRAGLRLFLGYSFLYVSSVARPGDPIDRVINPTQGPGFSGSPNTALNGPPRPTFPGRDSDFWAQGLNIGVEFRY
jgi:hypothetical protein